MPQNDGSHSARGVRPAAGPRGGPPGSAYGEKPPLSKTHRGRPRPPFECIALVLQGGGALGAYQAGVYQGLVEADLHPDWVAGTSIGAVNAAIIAGNPPDQGVEALRAFWECVTSPPQGLWSLDGWPLDQMRGEAARTLLNQLNAFSAVVNGAAGFFGMRSPPPWLEPPGSLEATSFYETKFLRATLERFVDFDRINAGLTRVSLGAVNVRTGNFVYFDNTTHIIRPEHVMGSGALPPGFPAVEIEGEHYWDGGLVSNTPLDWVVRSRPPQDTLAFQVDLWSADGDFPRDLAEVAMRQKEIQYSSRTRAVTDFLREFRVVHCALASLLEKLPPDLRDGVEAQQLAPYADHKVFSVVHLIYRSKHYEGNTKDYEFSRRTMQEHWEAGYNDAVHTLRHPEVLERPQSIPGVATFDLARDGRE
jgi:NTE family protein